MSMEYQITLHLSHKKTYMWVQQLELDMEQWTGLFHGTNGVVQSWKRSMTRLYIVTQFI